MNFAVWITGLPGSGKSTIARELLKLLSSSKAEILSLDELRKKVVKKQEYSEKERDFVYKKLADMGIKKLKEKNIIFDATAHKRKYRSYARNKIKKFIETYIRCPLEISIKRETKRKQDLVKREIYRKALIRKRTGKQFQGLGEVIGIDIPYEEPEEAEIIIESDKTGPEKAAQIIFSYLAENNFIKKIKYSK